jgi:hypothetical protein
VEIFKEVSKRTVALIILRVSGTLAGGSIAGVELWQAALLAAFIGVMDVAESLSRAYVVDGDLTLDEINRSFASSAEAELVENRAKSTDEELANAQDTLNSFSDDSDDAVGAEFDEDEYEYEEDNR